MASQRDIRTPDRLRQEHQADHAGDAVRGGVEAEARPGRDARGAAVQREARRGPRRPRRRPRRRGPPAPGRARGRQAPDRADHDGPRRWPGPLNTNIVRFAARDIIDNPGDLAVITVGRKGRDAMRRTGVPLEAHFATLRRPADLRRRPAARPARHRRLPGRHLRPGRHRLQPAGSRRSSSARRR